MERWYSIAHGEIGTKEIKGRRHNSRVLEYFKRSGHGWVKDDETAWCSAFVNWAFAKAGIKGSGSLAARSWLHWGKKLYKPKKGCVVVFKRGNSNWQGHVGFYVSETKNYIKVLGGNQRNAVNIKSYPKSKLLGYRWPSTIGNSRRVKGKVAAGTSGIMAAVSSNLPSIQGNIAGIDASWVPYALTTLGIIGLVVALGYVVWRQHTDEQEKGEESFDDFDAFEEEIQEVEKGNA